MKDISLVLHRMQADGINPARLNDILLRHLLLDTWEQFGKRFLKPDAP